MVRVDVEIGFAAVEAAPVGGIGQEFGRLDDALDLGLGFAFQKLDREGFGVGCPLTQARNRASVGFLRANSKRRRQLVISSLIALNIFETSSSVKS
ncbi:MAG: hypothetical protein WDN31_01000 [Hyphomicrobium sp.]